MATRQVGVVAIDGLGLSAVSKEVPVWAGRPSRGVADVSKVPLRTLNAPKGPFRTWPVGKGGRSGRSSFPGAWLMRRQAAAVRSAGSAVLVVPFWGP